MKSFLKGLLLIMMVTGVVFSAGCAVKSTGSADAGIDDTAGQVEVAQETSPEVDLNQEGVEADASVDTEDMDAEKEVTSAMDDFQPEDIFFEFDKALLTDNSRDVLYHISAWMMANGFVKLQLEGHADERGTSEYNIALGDRRAESAKAYLVNLGIEDNRLSTISYGEELPLDPGHTEEAWAKNRRVHFEVLER